MPVLEVKSLSLSFGGLRVLKGVSFGVEAGTITSLVGPNGAGKTSVFNIISRLVSPSAGEVWLDGSRIDKLGPHAAARRGLGRMFQDPRIFKGLSVIENALAGARLRANHPWHALVRDRRTASEWRDAEARIGTILGAFGLGARLHERGEDLSFAEQRFLSFARCLAGEPTILLLDEPTVGLDVRAIATFTERLRKLVRAGGITVLLVEHNMDVVMSISDCVHLLVQGEVVASGPTAEIRRHARMIEAYLGDRYVAQGA
jgi:ABC-type branched-subunit amino acid transport system ATPase component